MEAFPLTAEILKYGGPGLVILGLGYVIRILWVAYSTAQEKRIADHQSMTVKVVEALNANTIAQNANAVAQNANVIAVNALAEIVKTYGRIKQ